VKNLIRDRLQENLRSIDLSFATDDWQDLDRAVSNIDLQGDRYPAEQNGQVGY
jgi:hypothetical protein